MKKIICIILILTTIGLFAEESVPEPYGQDEFHPILYDVRRASIIFCGAFPLGYMYSSIIGDQFFLKSDEFAGLDETERSNKEIETKLMSSLIFAGVVMFIDLIIEKFFRR